jgi:hypothetical protein
LFIDGQVLIVGVVDLDIGRVAHINSGSYREEAEHTGKENNIQTWHRCVNNNDDMSD